MINIKSRTCIFENCKTQPLLSIEGETKPLYCSIHKKENMVDVKHKTCLFEGCKTIPIFNFEGEKIALYCYIHKKENMVNVKNKICKAVNCKTVANRNYKGYCAYCFTHLFPNDPKTLQAYCKTKEIAVRNFINNNYEGFQHDLPLYIGGCDCSTRRRIDHRKLINNTMLCIETDENQYKTYDKQDEIKRYNDLYLQFSAKFIFIRFNPDKYIENGVIKNTMIAKRLTKLKDTIDEQIKRISNNENKDLIEIVYLFYDV